MKLSKLKKLLETGAIEQNEFDALAKDAEDDTKETEEPEGGEDDADPEDSDSGMSEAKLQKLIQTAVDRATNKLGNENKRLRDTLEKTRKEKLSADELKAVELQEKEAELAEKEKQIKDKENRMYAIKALRKAELDDGSEGSLDLLDLVLGEDEASIDLKIAALKKLADRLVKSNTESIFRSNGRVPAKGGRGASDVENPWSEDHWNYTKQIELEMSNPELAKTLKAAAKK